MDMLFWLSYGKAEKMNNVRECLPFNGPPITHSNTLLLIIECCHVEFEVERNSPITPRFVCAFFVPTTNAHGFPMDCTPHQRNVVLFSYPGVHSVWNEYHSTSNKHLLSCEIFFSSIVLFQRKDTVYTCGSSEKIIEYSSKRIYF